LRQTETDNINQIITITDYFYSYLTNRIRTSDHIKQQVTLTMITLSSFHCNFKGPFPSNFILLKSLYLFSISKMLPKSWSMRSMALLDKELLIGDALEPSRHWMVLARRSVFSCDKCEASRNVVLSDKWETSFGLMTLETLFAVKLFALVIWSFRGVVAFLFDLNQKYEKK
jgi:hypothetical protein